MRISTSVSILLVTATLSVKAQTTSAARFSSYCGLLQNKIYCYGGSQGTREDEIPDSTMFVLDISKANGANMTDLQSNWKVVTPNTAGVNTERRESSQCAVVGGSLLVISGGFGGADIATHLVDQTIAYDSESNSWKKYPNYFEANINRQIYWASAVEVPSKGLAFFGGYEHHIDKSWYTPLVKNMTAFEFNKGYSRAIGYMGVVYLDINNANNPWSVPYQASVPTFSAQQSSIFHSASKQIFYFGGTYEDITRSDYSPATNLNWHPFSHALTFDTVTSIWKSQTLEGTIPTSRVFHTTTLLPNGESTVLLYGGEYNSAASPDYCFTLDLKTYNWTQQNINSNYADLRRTRHSAILANKDSLFIVLGLDGISNVTSIPIVLNISNPSVITYSEKYTDPSLMLDDSNNNSPNGTKTPEGPSSSGLSAGAIAGIAVGAAVAGILAFAAIFFCLRKKKAEQQQREQAAAQHNIGTIDPNQEPIEVNWDEIEKQYSEIPGSKLTEGFHAVTNVYSSRNSLSREENVSNTIIGNAEQRHNTSPLTHSSNVSYPPNAVDEVQCQPFILKPDGANSS